MNWYKKASRVIPLSQKVKENALSFAKIIPQKYEELLRNNEKNLNLGYIDIFSPYDLKTYKINIFVMRNYYSNYNDIAVYNKENKAILIFPGHYIRKYKTVDTNIFINVIYNTILHELTHSIDPSAQRYKKSLEYEISAELNSLIREIINEVQQDTAKENEILQFLKSSNKFSLSFLDQSQLDFLYDIYHTRKDLFRKLKTAVHNEIFAKKNNFDKRDYT